MPKSAAASLLLFFLSAPLLAAEPDYSTWNMLLARHYDPARGMEYAGLKARDAATLQQLRRRMAAVDLAKLSRNEQLAFWINLYNISVVGIVVDHYPVKTIRDISTDPIVRLNVFKKDLVPFGSARISLDEIEHKRIREVFRDPRIHFAINCAATSCPSIRHEAYVGARIDAQLDDQTRSFLNGPLGVSLSRRGKTLIVRTTKIMDWFGDDFDQWGGGKLAFLRRYLSAGKVKVIDSAADVKIDYDDYDWSLNQR
ncbi:MAG TPA: DUF547 domain-containing protein [Thermoanaerobaculia bacterium]|nr:DUF547 domain-containing protein [Thermoanaerobaculia bacterium]